MYHSLSDFFKSWEFEAGATSKVLKNLTDESLKQEVTPDQWSLGRIAWHTVTAIKVISSQAGLRFTAPSEDWSVPSSANFIAESYTDASNNLVEALETHWTDETLLEKIDFFGMKMTKGSLLLFLNQHQTHHRGQMTILMRQAGLSVPGIYGPSKEEWTQFGMTEPRQTLFD
ncbi:putative damage-inducible protein DinB [Cytobacillus firmus]|uniref:Putative damage-inducible protein DinB n=2 Tax=Cytobacillus TaxID=2675230 RepID=A0A366JUS9_CYTFI|nr:MULTISPECIES: DinB family protein [Cytobacillus]RBP92878.1 putative damage-inducible protein DinB [Cytobacillus firmus]TDX42480.1 putative damage-inducible protein DinB [Cytobacillus oceanisediminis]